MTLLRSYFDQFCGGYIVYGSQFNWLLSYGQGMYTFLAQLGIEFVVALIQVAVYIVNFLLRYSKGGLAVLTFNVITLMSSIHHENVNVSLD